MSELPKADTAQGRAVRKHGCIGVEHRAHLPLHALGSGPPAAGERHFAGSNVDCVGEPDTVRRPPLAQHGPRIIRGRVKGQPEYDAFGRETMGDEVMERTASAGLDSLEAATEPLSGAG